MFKQLVMIHDSCVRLFLDFLTIIAVGARLIMIVMHCAVSWFLWGGGSATVCHDIFSSDFFYYKLSDDWWVSQGVNRLREIQLVELLEALSIWKFKRQLLSHPSCNLGEKACWVKLFILFWSKACSLLRKVFTLNIAWETESMVQCSVSIKDFKNILLSLR